MCTSAHSLPEHECANNIADGTRESQLRIHRSAWALAFEHCDHVAQLVADRVLQSHLPEAEVAQRVKSKAARPNAARPLKPDLFVNVYCKMIYKNFILNLLNQFL